MSFLGFFLLLIKLVLLVYVYRDRRPKLSDLSSSRVRCVFSVVNTLGDPSPVTLALLTAFDRIAPGSGRGRWF